MPMLAGKASPWVRVSEGCGRAAARLQRGVQAAPVPPAKAPRQRGYFWFPISQALLWAAEAGAEPGAAGCQGDGMTG